MSEYPNPSEQRTAGNRPFRNRRWPRLLKAAAAHHRCTAADTVLAVVLTFVAGAINAGGFLAIGHYTSHMTGILSEIADHLVIGTLGVVVTGILSLFAFIAGASVSALLINWGRRNNRKRQYAYPITLEALLLLAFGAVSLSAYANIHTLPLTMPLLCFTMGLQNATITKLSGARIRTTHVTGMITDIGIELGKLIYIHRKTPKMNSPRVVADRKKLSLLTLLVMMFLIGGVIGASGFAAFGFIFCVPLSAVLFVLACPHILKR